MTRCPCGFPRDVCWRCAQPLPMKKLWYEGWTDAVKDMDEDKGEPQQPKEILDHDRVDDSGGHRTGGD